MNLRVALINSLGWCPGVKAAAGFLPDRDIPPRSFILAVFTSLVIGSSAFLAVDAVAAYLPFSPTKITVSNNNFVIHEHDGCLYLAYDVTTDTGYNTPNSAWVSSIYVAELLSDGGLKNPVKVGEFPASVESLDFHITASGEMLLALRQGYDSSRTRKPGISVAASPDGVNWGKFTEVYAPKDLSVARPGEPETGWAAWYPSLVEKDGEVYLFFSQFLSDGKTSHSIDYRTENPVMYLKRGSGGVWSPAVDTGANASTCSTVSWVHAFLNKENEIQVLAGFTDSWADRGSGFQSSILKEAGATTPEPLTSGNVLLKGAGVWALYSESSRGYYLLKDEAGDTQSYTIYFGEKWNEWNLVKYFTAYTGAWRKGSFAELGGRLVLVFKDTVDHRPPATPAARETSLFMVSGKGKDWTDLQQVKVVNDPQVYSRLYEQQRGNVPQFLGVATALISFLLLVRRYIP